MKNNKRDEKEDTENKTSGTKILLGLVGASIVAFGGFCTNLYLEHKTQEQEIKRNLAPNAFYFGKKPSKYEMQRSSILYNEDIDKDGKYESVLEFKIKQDGEEKTISTIIEKQNQEIKLRRYGLVNGKIKYSK